MKSVLLAAVLLVPVRAGAAVIDDSDLSGGPSPVAMPGLQAEGRREKGVLVFPLRRVGAAEVQTPPGQRGVFGKLELVDPSGRALPGRMVKVLLAGKGLVAEGETDAKGEFFVPVAANAPAGPAALRFRLENRVWSIQEPGGSAYEWNGGDVIVPAAGAFPAGEFRFDPAKASGRVGYVHLQFLEVVDLFQREQVGLGWWKKRLGVNFPGDADYFSPWAFELNITKAEQWDVNLHELGHAVMAAGTRSYGGGGQHKIDECYNEGLAWSEGFATFLAGAARLDRGDPDARFQYLVPRRAPIRIEHVPQDVCQGDTNEWRVAAGLWDLYDTNADGTDGSTLAFGRFWKAIAGQRMGGLDDAWGLVRGALSPEEAAAAEAALRQNTVLRGPALVAPPVRRLPERSLDALAAPDFDGTGAAIR